MQPASDWLEGEMRDFADAVVAGPHEAGMEAFQHCQYEGDWEPILILTLRFKGAYTANAWALRHRDRIPSATATLFDLTESLHRVLDIEWLKRI